MNYVSILTYSRFLFIYCLRVTFHSVSTPGAALDPPHLPGLVGEEPSQQELGMNSIGPVPIEKPRSQLLQ